MAFDKSIWGNTTWYLFHTLAHNIKETKFSSVKSDLIYVVKSVCSNLPCPECSDEAVVRLNRVDFDKIHSKEQFKLLLFNFHNQVNIKLGKPIYLINELDEKYATANIRVICDNFFKIYSRNTNIPQMMSHSFRRQNTLSKIRIALDKIISGFN